MSWARAVLDDVCEVIQDGAHRSPQVLHKNPGPDRYRYLTSKNIRLGYLKLDTVEYCESDFHDVIYARCNPEFGDVLLTKDGANTGNVAINTLDEPFSLLSSVCLLKTNRERLLPKFLYYYLRSDHGFAQITGQMTGTAIKRIILKTIRRSTIPLPPLEEQKRIVAMLDEAFAALDRAIANTETNLANARDLFNSYLEAIFTQHDEGWLVKRFAELCTLQRGFDLPKHLRKSGDVPLVSSSGIIDSHDEKKIDGPGIAVGRSGSVGSVFYVAVDYWPLNTVLYVKDFHGNDVRFVYWFLKQFGLSAFAGGTGVPTLNRNNLHGLRVWVPSDVSAQASIAGQCDSLAEFGDQLAACYRHKLELLAELKQSILHKAFAGGLTTEQPAESFLFPGVHVQQNTTRLYAGVLAIAYLRHQKRGKLPTLGDIKREKIIHLVEAHCGLDLGRSPYKIAAGPADLERRDEVEAHARRCQFFNVEPMAKGNHMVPGDKFDQLVAWVRKELGVRLFEVEKFIDLLVPHETRQTEIVATAYAAWNNLLLDGRTPTDDEIIHEGRENWHPRKLKIDPSEFRIQLKWMRKQGVVPSGRGKLVADKREAM